MPDVPKNVLLWFRLTSPGLGEPGGLLQQKVAEIFSSDRPPFYKGFLRLDTTETELVITLHQVFGEDAGRDHPGCHPAAHPGPGVPSTDSARQHSCGATLRATRQLKVDRVRSAPESALGAPGRVDQSRLFGSGLPQEFDAVG